MVFSSPSLGELVTPRIFLFRMFAFLALTIVIILVLFFRVETAFSANPGLNGLIILVLLFGVFHSIRQVVGLWPEIEWVNSYRNLRGNIDHLIITSPRLLAPLAVLLKSRGEIDTISPPALRATLDSINVRLDEARDLSRYLIGLLIFLGLLGTFWGLLEAVAAVGRTVAGLDMDAGGSVQVFEELRTGLEAPLSGMGKAFSSSLFGLSGSLVLGFLDLQAGQAQNRFYNSLEDWLLMNTGQQGLSEDHLASDENSLSTILYNIENLHRSSLQAHAEGQQVQKALAQIAQNQTEQNAATAKVLKRLADALERRRS